VFCAKKPPKKRVFGASPPSKPFFKANGGIEEVRIGVNKAESNFASARPDLKDFKIKILVIKAYSTGQRLVLVSRFQVSPGID